MAKRRRRRPPHGRERKYTGRDVTLRVNAPPMDEEDRAWLRDWFTAGWARWWPIQGLRLVALARASRMTGDDELAEVDLNEPLWDDPATESHDNRDYRLRTQTYLQRFADRAGLPQPRTLGDLITLSEAVGLVVRNDDGLLVAPEVLPLVSELGVLTPEEIAEEDRLRWREAYDHLEQRFIAHFVHELLDTWTGTAEELSVLLGCDVDDAIETVLLLAESDDFSVDRDPRKLRELPFTVTCDWERFDETRIQLGPPATDDDHPPSG